MFRFTRQTKWNLVSKLKMIPLTNCPISQRGNPFQLGSVKFAPLAINTSRTLSTKRQTQRMGFQADRIPTLVSDMTIDNNGRLLNLDWDDNTKSSFHAVWLRFNCHCKHCLDANSNMPSIVVHEVPLTSTISKVEETVDGKIIVHFQEDGHKGKYPAKWLKNMCYSKESLRKRREAVKPVFDLESTVPELYFNEVMGSDKHVYEWLRLINEHGLCLLKDVPTKPFTLRDIIEKIGPIQRTPYGDIFDVCARVDSHDVAYSDSGLQHHTDQTNYEGPPGIQFLHCLKFDESVEGGETTFVELIHIAEEFRKDYPEEFHTLTTVPCPYVRVHEALENDQPCNMAHRRPAILLNSRKEIITIKWSPYYHGPLNYDEEYVEPFYRAYQLFARAIHNYPYRKSVRMVPGDLIAFNNRRIGHGRNPVIRNQGERHLQGGYLNIDDYRSKLISLANMYGDGSSIKCIFNSDWS